VDKRQTLVALTPKGTSVRSTMEVSYQSFLFDMYGVLSAGEQETLNTLLSKIEDNLSNR
jgi:DNA-binding MarR family transcriptional regulator